MSQILLEMPKVEAVNYFPALTGIRAVAAFLVFIHHFNLVTIPRFPILYDLQQEGHIGVTIFFVLSGFLICIRYSDNVELSRKWLGRYLFSRFARIFPVYFLLTTLTFIGFIISHALTKEILVVYFLNISLLKGYFEDYKFSGIAQGWSLTVEASFYLLAPSILFFSNRNKRYLLIFPLILLAVGFGLTMVFSKVDFMGFFKGSTFMLVYTFPGRCVEFMIGIGTALFIKNQWRSELQSKIKHLTFIGVGGILLCLLILTQVKGDYKIGLWHPLGIITNNLILPVFIGLLFIGLITEKTFVRRTLASRLFLVLGKSSYVFYLIHVGLIQAFISTHISGNPVVLFISLNLLSVFLHFTLEEPLHKKLRTFLKNR